MIAVFGETSLAASPTKRVMATQKFCTPNAAISYIDNRRLPEIHPAQAGIPEQAREPIVVKVKVTSTSPKPDGLPVYRAIPGAPVPLLDVAPTAWGRYRVSNRPSQQIEHVHHVISAGYLR